VNGFVAGVRKKLEITDEQKTLIFTMPMSAGDVYVSTGVVSALRSKFRGYKIFFATSEPYKSILDGNPDIDLVIKFDDWLMNVPLLEQIFTEVYTPNIAIQHVGSNWVHGGKGRLLGDEMAAQCQVEYDSPKIELEKIDLPEGPYICFNPTSGKGQWEARNYIYWQEVVENLVGHGLNVIQVGLADDPLYKNVVDFRSKTNFKQLAYVVSKATLMLGVDTVTMHMAAGLDVPYVSLFGSSYPTSTGPVNTKKTLNVLIETPDRYTCDKACYKHQCAVDKEHPCINEIAPKIVVTHALAVIGKTLGWGQEKVDGILTNYREVRPKISGYTHILNPNSQGLPYVESIMSMLGFCDEVIVVDGGSTDGSTERLKTEITDERVKFYVREWDWNEPGMDGQQKAFGRANCTGDFLWQQDADEIVHEDDYEKIRKLVRRFPTSTNLMSLPVIELWGGAELVRTDRHSWKWRLSRNDFRITHGINKDARVYDEKTGKTYAKKGMSDGCEYVDIMTGEYIPHKNFYTQEHESLRNSDPVEYGTSMNDLFDKLPCVFHYSWANIPRKIRHFVSFWDRCWSNLYHEEKQEQRFFVGRDPASITKEEVGLLAMEVAARGGEHGKAKLFKLNRTNPGMMKEWINRISGEFKDALG
jgi:ADP-heptose:LPS heptosyltransferase/glycosyltransferase involved in cell wall biosynthesis